MNSKQKKQYTIIIILMTAILIIDQVVKILVKTNMHIGEEIPLIGNWCLIHFVENEGFAFGMAFGGNIGKIILSVFRFIASAGVLWYLLHIIKKGARTSLVICLSLIFVGAVGNLIDSCFYGLIFNESYYNVAQLFPPEGGYAPFLRGRVVDMFYFPIIDSTWPSWVPFCGGKPFVFFNAIFNIADAAISIGAVWLIIDQLIFSNSQQTKNEELAENSTSTDEQTAVE
ncbi:MAG: lipoprotein signal peptidase [Bacteroidales bacterium]|nr:lipoprotein signal peptidase [Candidatus Colimorpha merdihippi]MCQ2282860.1 lipoprotein signal peptidase [Bacteroidales bacterium]